MCTEGGRCVRPLYIVENNNIRLKQNTIDDIKIIKIMARSNKMIILLKLMIVLLNF
jgi:hypothetical protein